ncbi:hypothetical protein FisN_23Lh011 [Fistulifera solaris]|uniref:Uncharacterized protein n=1 Tax=Fistulifera solaris TaxID=1519565 RepID=A0A1Z5KJQ1_FISSO|nr:hypothetical protein FisN_23Lh011 [Fistulifera solaris]|eukprot:GAX26486.1 hypothetical protein FisN_23Lh011 [Fistulifera solaris]
MSVMFLLVLLSCFAETQGAWVSNSPFVLTTTQSVRCASQASNYNDPYALSGQILPQGILGMFREPSTNKMPWKGSGAVGFQEPNAIREMSILDRSSPSQAKAETTKTQQLKLSQASEPGPKRSELVPFVQRPDPNFMSPDVIASVRINQQQYQLPQSMNAVSTKSSSRKARDAAILRFESSSWAAANLKSEKASADVLTRVNIGIGAPIAGTSSARVESATKGTQEWTMEKTIKPSKDSADVLVKVQIHDDMVNAPVSQRVHATTATKPDQPDVVDKVNINEGKIANNSGATAKPTKASADVQTPVKIHEDVKLKEVAEPTEESADLQSKGATPSSTLQINGDKQDIVKPFDKSNSQPPIEPILVDKLPESNYKNDLDDIITVDSQVDSFVTNTPSTTQEAAAKDSSDLKTPAEKQEATSVPVVQTPEESKELLSSVQITKDAKPARNPKPGKKSADVLTSVKIHESADVLTPVKIHAEKKPVQVATPLKDSADVLTPVKIHSDTKPTSTFAKPSKESADVLTPVKIHDDKPPAQTVTPVKKSADVLTSIKIHSEKTPSQTAKPSKASADVQTPVKIHEDMKPVPRGTPLKDSADVLTPVKIHAEEKPVRAAAPVKKSADVQASVKIHAEDKPRQPITPLKDSTDIQTPVKIHAEEEPRQPFTPLKDSADVLTPVKIHADEKARQSPTPLKDSADVQTPIKIHAEEKPRQPLTPLKDSADVQTSVKIHAAEKPRQSPTPLKDSADVLTPVKIHAETVSKPLAKPSKDSADVQTPVKIHSEDHSARRESPADLQTAATVSTKSSVKPKANNTIGIKSTAPVTPATQASSSKSTKMDGTLGGIQSDSVTDLFASRVIADVITNVKMYGDRIPAASASEPKSPSGLKWKSDFDPNRWAPLSY